MNMTPGATPMQFAVLVLLATLAACAGVWVLLRRPAPLHAVSPQDDAARDAEDETPAPHSPPLDGYGLDPAWYPVGVHLHVITADDDLYHGSYLGSDGDYHYVRSSDSGNVLGLSKDFGYKAVIAVSGPCTWKGDDGGGPDDDRGRGPNDDDDDDDDDDDHNDTPPRGTPPSGLLRATPGRNDPLLEYLSHGRN